jgi:hypothetical protein
MTFARNIFGTAAAIELSIPGAQDGNPGQITAVEGAYTGKPAAAPVDGGVESRK